jgi:hypothetical protein
MCSSCPHELAEDRERPLMTERLEASGLEHVRPAGGVGVASSADNGGRP